MLSGSWRRLAEGMEKGGLTLAEATARFEQGMRLVQHCNFLLDTAELEITQLRESYQRPGASGGGIGMGPGRRVWSIRKGMTAMMGKRKICLFSGGRLPGFK